MAHDITLEPTDETVGQAFPPDADGGGATGTLTPAARHDQIENPKSIIHNDSDDELPVTIIERKPGWKFVDLAELWRYRELLYFLTWRDVKVRYKQTVLGAAWAVLQPFATMVVFSLFLGRLGNMSSGDLPYPLFAFAGLLPWTFFATAISQAGSSVVGSQNLVTKVYFPRLFIPMGAVAAALVDLAVACGMLLAMMLYYGVMPGWGLLLAPLLVIGLTVAALGVGVMLSALTVAYRDFRYVVPFMVQLWMFATPTIYMQADSVISPKWHSLMPFNPAFGLILNFRQATLGGPLDLWALAVSLSVSVLLLIGGCLYFRRVERSFADII
ncbi:MAG TPA: ABC transporter permease [Pirellulales bacterium]|nr:ABC transporter permease [Pirellulales bacterium]